MQHPATINATSSTSYIALLVARYIELPLMQYRVPAIISSSYQSCNILCHSEYQVIYYLSGTHYQGKQAPGIELSDTSYRETGSGYQFQACIWSQTLCTWDQHIGFRDLRPPIPRGRRGMCGSGELGITHSEALVVVARKSVLCPEHILGTEGISITFATVLQHGCSI